MKALPEIRDWASFALGLLGLLLAWRYRNRAASGGTHHVLELHDSVPVRDGIEIRPAYLELAPAHGRATTSLELTTGRPPLGPTPTG